MQTKEENQSALERRIDIAITEEALAPIVENRLKQMARTVKMHGFRPGKVPMSVIRQTYSGQVRAEAVGECIEQILGQKLQEQNLRVAGQPQVQPKAGSETGLEFEAIFEVYPEVVIGDLADKDVEKASLEVGDAEVDRTIDQLRKQRTTYEAVDRESQEGDRVVVDFTGRKDGVEFDGGKATDFPFVLGAGAMLKDFEAAALGLKAGDSKTFQMTFPEDYHATQLAGQTVEFDIAVKAVEAPILPEVDADFARALGVADGEVSKLRDEVRTNLEREVKSRTRNLLKEQVMDALLAACPIEAPKALVGKEAEQMADTARSDMQQRGMNPAELQISPAWFVEQAERRVKLGLILAEVVKVNELRATPEQIRGVVEEFAVSYEDPQEVIAWYYQQPQRLAHAEALAIEENVVQWVLGKARVTDKAVGFDELMGNAA